jgi:hypothetical protein
VVKRAWGSQPSTFRATSQSASCRRWRCAGSLCLDFVLGSGISLGGVASAELEGWIEMDGGVDRRFEVLVY